MSRVELIWVWKLLTVMEDRTKDRKDCGALRRHKEKHEGEVS